MSLSSKIQKQVTRLKKAGPEQSMYDLWVECVRELENDILQLMEVQHIAGIDGEGEMIGIYAPKTEKIKKKRGTWRGAKIILYDDGVWRASWELIIEDGEIKVEGTPRSLDDYLLGRAPSHSGGEIWSKGREEILQFTDDHKADIIEGVKFLMKQKLKSRGL